MTSNIDTQAGALGLGSAPLAHGYREDTPVADPHDFRARVEHAIESLITLLDSIDAPGEDLEPEPLEDNGDAEVEGIMSRASYYRGEHDQRLAKPWTAPP